MTRLRFFGVLVLAVLAGAFAGELLGLGATVTTALVFAVVAGVVAALVASGWRRA